MGAGAGEHHVLRCGLQGAVLSLGRGQRKRSEKPERQKRGEEGPGIIAVSLRGHCCTVSITAALQLAQLPRAAWSEGADPQSTSFKHGLSHFCLLVPHLGPAVHPGTSRLKPFMVYSVSS